MKKQIMTAIIGFTAILPLSANELDLGYPTNDALPYTADASPAQLSCEIVQKSMTASSGPSDGGELVTSKETKSVFFMRDFSLDAKNDTAEMILTFKNGQQLKVQATEELGKENKVYYTAKDLSVNGEKIALTLGHVFDLQISVSCKVK